MIRSASLGVGVAILVLAGLLILLIRSAVRSPRDGLARASETGKELAPPPPIAEQATKGARASLENAHTEELQEPKLSTADSISSRPAQEVVTTAMRSLEDTLFGRINVGAFLDLALMATEGQLDTRVIVEQDGSGQLQFPINELAPELRAEFRVAAATSEGTVLAIRGLLDQPADPYLLESAARRSGEVFVQGWLKSDKTLKDLVIHASLAVDERGTEQYFSTPWDKGTIVEGMILRINVTSGWSMTAKAHGIIDGQPQTWNIDPVLLGSLDHDRIRMLGERLLSMYSQVSRKER